MHAATIRLDQLQASLDVLEHQLDQALSNGESSTLDQLEEDAHKRQDIKVVTEQLSGTASGLSVDDILKELPHGAEQ